MASGLTPENVNDFRVARPWGLLLVREGTAPGLRAGRLVLAGWSWAARLACTLVRGAAPRLICRPHESLLVLRVVAPFPNLNCPSREADLLLVATGVSQPGDFHELDRGLLAKFCLAAERERNHAWYLDLMSPAQKPNMAWLDPSRLYIHPQAFQDLLDDLWAPFRHADIDYIAGIDSTGSAVPKEFGEPSKGPQSDCRNVRRTPLAWRAHVEPMPARGASVFGCGPRRLEVHYRQRARREVRQGVSPCREEGQALRALRRAEVPP